MIRHDTARDDDALLPAWQRTAPARMLAGLRQRAAEDARWRARLQAPATPDVLHHLQTPVDVAPVLVGVGGAA